MEIITEEDWNSLCTHLFKKVNDWTPSVRGCAFAQSCHAYNMVTDIEMNDLCNAISAPGLLWQPSILQAFRPVQVQCGWLCLWYKDCRSFTLLCKHCKRSTGWNKPSKQRNQSTFECAGLGICDNDEFPKLAGSKVEHSRFCCNMLWCELIGQTCGTCRTDAPEMMRIQGILFTHSLVT